MTVAASASTPKDETALQKEQRTFGVLFRRLIDAFLNRMFDLRPKAASSRLQYLIFLFLLSGFLISLIYYPLTVWAQYIQDIFIYVFNPALPQNFAGNPFTNIANYAIQAFTDPRILLYLPIFLAPFFIALQTAANYLADIFELDNPGVARHFVGAVALTGSNETIRITRGEVNAAHRTLPIFLIGGPGKAMVDVDSVALFEKPDGTTHVIGPTGKERGGKAQLDGFERFRQAIDLRDHFIELRDEEGRSGVVTGRSLDGIPITASDVSFMFSVHRGGQKPTTANPYPFSEKAVEQLIYKATSRVTPHLSNPSTFEFSWINNMDRLIRSRLGGFMNNHKLTEYLASVGKPEMDRINKRENEISEEMKKLAAPANGGAPKVEQAKDPPEFMPRYEISNHLFSQFTEEFSNLASGRGVELKWVGLGTWKVPVEIFPETKVVPEHHLQAWKLSRENLQKEGEPAAKRWKNEAAVQKIMNLIQDVPVAKYHDATPKFDHNHAMRAILEAYRQQLIEAAEFVHVKGEAVSLGIIQAIENINKVLGFKGWHWVGSVQPDNGDSSGSGSSLPDQESDRERSVEFVYQELVNLAGGDEATADRLIEFEHSQFPDESRSQWIDRAIQRLLRDRNR